MNYLEPSLEPYCDDWVEYRLPCLCQERIIDVCNDILKKGGRTIYPQIYDAIYILVEADIEREKMESEILAYA